MSGESEFHMEAKASTTAGKMSGMDWKFLGLFSLYLGIFVGLAQIPQSLSLAISKYTAWAVAAFWSLFFIPVVSFGTHVTFYQFTMEIILECTGVHYIGIFVSAVMAFQGRSLSSKAKGICVGIALILFLNMLRLGMLGMLGNYSERLFSLMHLSVWHALFTLFVLLFWTGWVNGKVRISWEFGRKALVAATAASLSFWVLYRSLDYYLGFLSFVANLVLTLLGALMTLPSAVVIRDGMIGYISGEYVVYSKTGIYTLNLAVYLALSAANARFTNIRKYTARFLAGAGFMLVSHLGLLAMDWSLEMAASETVSSVLTWCIVLSSMIAPVLAWLAANMLLPSKNEYGKGQL